MPSTARRSPPWRARPACATTPSRARASARTAIFAPNTCIRRGTQNSRATRDRLDHSAPIQVEPITKPSTAAAAPNPIAPRLAGARQVERLLGQEVVLVEVRELHRRPADVLRGHAGRRRRRVVQALLARLLALRRPPAASSAGPRVVGRRRGAVVEQGDDDGEHPAQHGEEQEQPDEPAGAEAVQFGPEQRAAPAGRGAGAAGAGAARRRRSCPVPGDGEEGALQVRGHRGQLLEVGALRRRARG